MLQGSHKLSSGSLSADQMNSENNIAEIFFL